MDYNAFITEIVEKVIASIPSLVVIVSMVAYKLHQIVANTDLFPEEVQKTNKNFTDSFDKLDNKVQASLDNFQTRTDQMLDKSFEKITNNVTNVMSRMETELRTYREQLQAVKAQMNFLIKENRAMVDIIVNLTAKNPELVKKGMSAKVADMLNMTQEELEAYSSQLIDNLPLLETVLKEALVNFDEEDVNNVLEAIGYERKEDREEA